MLMKVLASALLFLFIGPFQHGNSGGTKETGVSTLQVKEVYIAVNDTLELNCSINATIYNHPTQLGWKHNALILINFTYCVVNNNTIQLRKNHTQYDDAGVYECGLFNSSKFQSVQKIVVVVGEKPKSISKQQFSVVVYGKPVQEVTVKWPALQANATNELFFGRVPAGQIFDCVFNSTAQCSITPEFQNKNLSCYIGMDVLRTMFQRNELFKGTCSAPNFGHSRCDRLCAKVLVKNMFGASETDPPAAWNLQHKTQCPPLHNLTVSLGEHHLTASWKRPKQIQEDVPVKYDVTYITTSLLTGKASHPQHLMANTKLAWKIDTIKPYSRYTFEAACKFSYQKGPAVYAEVTTKEAAPSEAPSSCEVKNRSSHDSFVSWKAPSIDAWNGIPKKFLVYYGDHRVAVNTSLAELQTRYNRSMTPGIMLKNLDPRKNYTFTVAMCTAAGCGNWSEPCLIRDNIEDDSDIKVVASPDERNATGVITWVAIAVGAGVGLGLVALIVYLIMRKRSQRKERPPLISVLSPLNGIHPYENPIDEGPSFCEDDQCYDSIDTIIHRPLLAADRDDAVTSLANLPVTEI